MLHDAARQWRTGSPEFGWLGQTVEVTKRALAIAEFRVTGTDQRFAGWTDAGASEKALLIAGFRLDIAAGMSGGLPGWTFVVDPRASVSFHALARWYQRSHETAPEALHDALCDVLFAVPALEPDCEIRIPTDGGTWCGIWLQETNGKRVPAIRSFLRGDAQ